MNLDIEILNGQFGIEGQIVFKKSDNGFVTVDIANSQATASIALQGAHLFSWIPRGARPVIWVSAEAHFEKGKPIRGGIPVCWPWFGNHPSDPSLPAHGFARTSSWKVIQTEALKDGSTLIVFSLIAKDEHNRLWPYSCDLEIHYIIGESLKVDLVTRNTGESDITISDALHTYFAVSDVRNISINGLEGCSYLDKVDNEIPRKKQVGAVHFAGEIDRIYLQSSDDCVIDDPGLQRRIRISKLNSDSTVVWNPWIEKSGKMDDMGQNGYLNMVCVESTNAADDEVRVAAGDEHHLWVRYSIE